MTIPNAKFGHPQFLSQCELVGLRVIPEVFHRDLIQSSFLLPSRAENAFILAFQ
jgi:hypothetical protein